MPIVRKSKSDLLFNKLKERVDKLQKVMEGKKPNENLCDLYALNSSDYERDFTEIDSSELSIAVNDLASVINELKKARTLKADKLYNPKQSLVSSLKRDNNL